MSSSEEFKFSSMVINNDLPSPPPLYRENSVATSDFIHDTLLKYNINADNDDLLLSQFDSKVFESFSDEPIEGFDQAQANIVTGELPDLLEQSASNAEDQMAESIEKAESLRLHTPPDPYQRVRYDGELDEDLRFISTPKNKGIELEISDIRSCIPPNMSVKLRISRTTTAFDPDQTVCCHPYPLYTKNKDAIVHDGSLLFPVSIKNIEEQRIIIDDLIMTRLKQSTLKTKTQWPIFTYDQFNCNGYHLINIDTAKSIISTYNLRWSVLRFQIFFVDENQLAHATHLSCETVPIYEYECMKIPLAYMRLQISHIKVLLLFR
ncbi:hypothetical protein I4U23_005426 [Adineta vaga]|nr:hypothetical protein I4U23_005426 [Adineta vaga]